MPPELLRKGRFDEIFFLDLPTQRNGPRSSASTCANANAWYRISTSTRLAAESEGYVGSEIEQAIIDAMYVGFNENREFNTEDMSTRLERQVPLSVSQRETIDALRDWLHQGRAQSASTPEK